jgi:hypothetical protein
MVISDLEFLHWVPDLDIYRFLFYGFAITTQPHLTLTYSMLFLTYNCLFHEFPWKKGYKQQWCKPIIIKF